ncbi:HesA/MoeB/ThiF family protein [Sulfurovum sp. ST-21]|uniref:ThiF family adenylyltransferase n=1 Tax=Sulfurovum indicum TaxID=2779528 RepID=A0A7M1S2H2_9BACT|nr:ThiF family adenylyltransferase [Sulfurovum indicum]QOR61221.1 ThiF family adenylyltransferase [Sulfurovum indicum]
MNRTIVKFTKETFDELKSLLLADRNEKHAFLLCNLAQSSHHTCNTVFLVDKIVIFDEKEISVSAVHVEIENDLVNGLFQQFVNGKHQALISCHSHPFEEGNVWFSGIDDANDQKLFEYFYTEITKHKPDAQMLTMVFGQKTIAARGYVKETKVFTSVDQIVVVGYPMKYITPVNKSHEDHTVDMKMYNRQILGFGEAGQKELSRLKVTLVGAGGTGSILAETLVRLGVKNLVIIDDDKLEDTNLNRWQGGKICHVGRYKVNILKDLLYPIAFDLKIKTFESTLFNEEVIDYIKDSDVVIGAVDSNKARYLLNRMALAYLIPYLDCSSGIVVEQGNIKELSARNVVVVPAATHCFNCEEVYFKKTEFAYDFVSESMKKEAQRRKYIQVEDISVKSPSVYPLNMLSVSTLSLEFMNLFWGYKDKMLENTYINCMTLENQGQKIAWEHQKPNSSCIDCQDRVALGDRAKVWELFFKEG